MKVFPTTTITASSWDELDEAENVSDKNLNKINMAESFSHNDEMKSIKEPQSSSNVQLVTNCGILKTL